MGKKLDVEKQHPSLFVSVTKKLNIEDLKKTLYEEVKKIHITRFPYNDFLYDENWTEEAPS